MERIGIIAFTRAGCLLAQKLAETLVDMPVYAGASVFASAPGRFACALGMEDYGNLAAWTESHFATDDALVFVGATGIAVRAIAPHVRDKFSDPAVVSVDEAGLFAVPLLSGHVGGANDLARAVASALGGQAVVSTATDVNGLFAVDEWAARNGFAIVERAIAKEIASTLLEGRPVGFYESQDCPATRFRIPVPDALLQNGSRDCPANHPDIGFTVSLDDTAMPFERTLHLVPRLAVVGVGCRKNADPAALERAVSRALAKARVSRHAVTGLASIDVKKDEPAIHALAQNTGWPTRFYTAEELAGVPGTFTASEFVKGTVGVDNVCERAACASGGTLILEKQAGDGVTVAIARQDMA